MQLCCKNIFSVVGKALILQNQVLFKKYLKYQISCEIIQDSKIQPKAYMLILNIPTGEKYYEKNHKSNTFNRNGVIIHANFSIGSDGGYILCQVQSLNLKPQQEQ